MTCYNLRTHDNSWRITKFDDDYNPLATYHLDASGRTCDCPAGVRPTCRHRQMLPRMLTAGIADSPAMYDHDGDQFIGKDVVDYYTEETCPGHVASQADPKVCGRCGVHIDSLRPPDDLEPEGLLVPPTASPAKPWRRL